MGKTICISNHKGGAGKTSITHNVGCALSKMGKKVLFIGVDGQANLETAFGLDPDEITNGTYDILTKDKILTADYIIKTNIENAFLIPANQEVFSADLELIKRPAGNFKLADAIEQIKDDFDFIFIDTPPSLNIITLNALIASNSIILVYTASDFSLDGLSQILSTLDEIQSNKRLNINDTKVIGAILNRYRSVNKTVNNKLKTVLEDVTEIPLYFTPISDTTEIEKAQFDHLPVTVYNPKHKVSMEFEKFARELIESAN